VTARVLTAVREVERKYEARPGQEPPSLSGLPGVSTETPPELFTLEAAYYDTADLRLLRNALTLRRRTGGDDAGWHLKTPGGGDARTEIRLPLAPVSAGVPGELSSLVRSYTRSALLEPVARISTTRTRRRLLGDEQNLLAEIVVDRVHAVALEDDRGRDWTEIEVEQAAGGAILADAIEARFADAGIARSSSPAKVDRVLGDRIASEPVREPGRRLTAGEVVLCYLRTQIAALAAGDLAVRRDEPDSVHRMRVAARRARSTLQAYASVLGGRAATRALIDELGWLGGQLSAARDVEVQRDRLSTRLGEVPPRLVDSDLRERLDRYFSDRAEQARTAALDTLDSDRYLQLLDRLDALAASGATRRAGKAVPKVLKTVAHTVDERVRACEGAAPGPDRDELVHAVRKAAKRLRYAIEVARPLAPGTVTRALARFTALQDLLGEHQDAVVAQAQLQALGGFTCGLLYQQERDIADERAADLGRAWRAARRAARPLWT